MSALRHGSLEGQDLSLLKAGNWLCDSQGRTFQAVITDATAIALWGPKAQWLGPDADGWIHAPEGGWSSNPVPGVGVYWRCAEIDGFHGKHLSDDVVWGGYAPIIAFRPASLAHPAPEQVASGREDRAKAIFEMAKQMPADNKLYPSPPTSGEFLSATPSAQTDRAEAQDAAVVGLLGLEAVRYVREGRDDRDYVCDLPCDAEDYGAQAVPRNPDGAQAASAIRSLTAERDALRKALEPFAENAELIDDVEDGEYCPSWSPFIPAKAYIAARAALAMQDTGQ